MHLTGLELLSTSGQPDESEVVARKHRSIGGDEEGQLTDAVDCSADNDLPANVHSCGMLPFMFLLVETIISV